MDKKITIRDIAKQAGVSIATVSYVINNRTDQRISDETKKKVLQIINLLDYKPNSSAQSLATSKTWNIALYLRPETSFCKRVEQSLLMEALVATLHDYNYHLLLPSNLDFNNLNYADAILCYDTPIDYFLQIGDNNYVPLIAIDTLINIPLFFQVCTDYVRIKQCALEHYQENPFTYVCLTPNNDNLESLIRNTFENVLFIHDYSDLHLQDNQFYAYSNASLHLLLKEVPNAFYIPVDLQQKANQIYDCIRYAMERIPDIVHKYFI